MTTMSTSTLKNKKSSFNSNRPYAHLTDKDLLSRLDIETTGTTTTITRLQTELDYRLNHAGSILGITSLPVAKSIVRPTSTINFLTSVAEFKGATTHYKVIKLLLKARRRLLKTATKIESLTNTSLPISK